MKIFVESYLDKNFGDDVMLQMLIVALKDHEIFIPCDNQVLTSPFSSYNNVQFVNIGNGFFNRFVTLTKFDIYLRIGGSIFQVRNWKNYFFRSQKIILNFLLRVFGVKLVVIGSNIGPFFNNFAKYLVSLDLKICHLVTVRDNISHTFLKKKNRESHVLCFPDILFSYYPNSNIRSNDVDECLGISVYRNVNFPSVNFNVYKKLAEISDEYISFNRKKILLFAFNSENENDISAAYNIYDMIKEKSFVEIIVYTGNPEHIVSNFSRCSSLIAIRFHAIVLAIIMGIPFIPLIYQNKTINMLDDIGYLGEVYSLDKFPQQSAKRLLFQINEINSKPFHLDKDIIHKSRGHISSLLDFINNTIK